MDSLLIALFLALHAGTAIVTLATAIASYGRSPRASRLARTCYRLATGVAMLGVLGVVVGLVHTASAWSAPGLTSADRARALSSGYAEALYNGICSAIVAVPAFVVARRTLRKRNAEP